MAKKKEILTFPNKYEIINVVDHNGYERMLELLPGYSQDDIDKELTFRCQNVSPVEILNERTIKSNESLYTKIYNETNPDELLHLLMRVISFSQASTFKVRYMIDILEEKEDVCETDLQKKTFGLALKCLKEKGVIPKKLKACYELSLGENDEEEPIV